MKRAGLYAVLAVLLLAIMAGAQEMGNRAKITAKNVKPTGLQGISQRQIDEHFDVLYQGYVRKYNEIQDRMGDVNLSEANPTYSPVRELKLEETYAMDGVKLHELYFENLGRGGQASGAILDLIRRDWGSYENWEAEFRAVGQSARGWAVLAYDPRIGHLHNYLLDAHNVGPIWQAQPLLIMDVYEHAYFIDYGTNRKGYIDAFMKNINWDVVNRRVSEQGIEAPRSRR